MSQPGVEPVVEQNQALDQIPETFQPWDPVISILTTGETTRGFSDIVLGNVSSRSKRKVIKENRACLPSWEPYKNVATPGVAGRVRLIINKDKRQVLEGQ